MAKRPNIVFTIADDQRYSLLGCHADPAVEGPVFTPNLDALAARGTAWRRAYIPGSTHGAVCAPSRAMLHTGCELFHTSDNLTAVGDLQSRRPGDDSTPHATLGSKLRDAGYHTHGVGKWHNGEDGFERSFNTGEKVFLGGMNSHYHASLKRMDDDSLVGGGSIQGHSTDIFSNAAEAFLDTRGPDDEQPFFLYVGYQAPHDPRITHYRWHKRFEGKDMPVPPNFLPQHDPLLPNAFERDDMLAEYPRTPEEVQWHHANYLAITAHMDEGIGKVHAKLRERGLEDNTIVVHTADHGLAVGRHGLFGKQHLYDDSVRVPLLMAGPGIDAGRDDERLCYQQDLHPTLLDMLGLDATSEFELLNGSADGTREAVSFAYNRWARGVREDRLKLIDMHFDGTHIVQLFDLGADAYEMNNLADDPAMRADRERLLGLLGKMRAAVDDPLYGEGGWLQW